MMIFNASKDDDESTCHQVLNNADTALFCILKFLDERTRVNIISVSKTHARILTSEAAFKWRVTRLHIERGIYFSPSLVPNTSWRDVFLYNYGRRNLWRANNSSADNQGQEEKDEHKFQLTVSARFRPKNLDGMVHEQHPPKKISLPLHQRLALIRMNRNITSQKEAFRVLMRQGGWFGKEQQVMKYQDEERDDGAKEEKVDECHDGAPTISGGVHLIDPKSNAAILVDRTKGLRRFDFDHVFDETSSQENIYQNTTMPLITEFINGFNATCLVYGQTGSGKTFSMFGPDVHQMDCFQKVNLKEKAQLPETFGILPRAIQEVFHALEYRRHHLGLNIIAEIGVSYVEVYGNIVSDLLRKGTTCGQSAVAAQRYVLDGSSEVAATSLNHTFQLLDKGEKQKRKAATAMNARSSRAHTLFIMTLRQNCTDTGISSTSRLFLADLGGSEQIKRSQPFQSDALGEEDAARTKQRVQEAVNINLGLLALKQCVEGLRNKTYVPYADSKLTMILSTGLGGDSKTAVIVCGAQEESHGPETIAAMKFGQTCRGIYNTVKTNANMLQSLLQSIDKSILKCEEKIRENERWEEVDVSKYDGNGTLIEVRTKTVVAGADSYRRELANLLTRKAELTGESIEDLYGRESAAVQAFGDFQQYTGVQK